MISLFVVFFFNATATTDIYTYCNPLSLHDVLPISLPPSPRHRTRPNRWIASAASPKPPCARTYRPAPKSAPTALIRGCAWPPAPASCKPKPAPCAVHPITSACAAKGRPRGPCMRSEEHTSELQSLMRISYAVFCLKKKKNNTHNHKPMMKKHTKKQYNLDE